MLMKFVATLLAPLVLVSFAGTALAGDPIPGLDVKLGKNPGGIAFAQTKTGKDGRFVFDNLAAGSYHLQALQDVSTTRQSINTAKSNIKGQMAVVNGNQEVTAVVELGMGDASTDIEITTDHGKIVGTVSRAVAPNTSRARSSKGPESH